MVRFSTTGCHRCGVGLCKYCYSRVSLAEARATGESPPDPVRYDTTPTTKRCQSGKCHGWFIHGGYWVVNEATRYDGVGPIRFNRRVVVCYQCLHRILDYNEANGYVDSEVERHYLPAWMSDRGVDTLTY